MGKIARFFMMSLLVTLWLTAAAWAEFVYVTPNGSKYHHAESRFIKGKDGIKKLTLEEAQKQGYEPSRDYLRYKARQEASEAKASQASSAKKTASKKVKNKKK